MVNWMHILWVAPIFCCLGFIACGLMASAGPIANNEEQIEDLQLELFKATKKIDSMCVECGLSIELNAKIKDLSAVLEERKMMVNSIRQLRGTINRMEASGRLGK